MQAGDAAADRRLAAARLARPARRSGPAGSRTTRRHDGGVPCGRCGSAPRAPTTSSSGAVVASAGRDAQRARPSARRERQLLPRKQRTACRASASASAGHGLARSARPRARSAARRRSRAGHSPTPTDTPGMPRSARGWRKSGIAATSARVYGWRGRSITSAAGPFSTTRPAYMTTMRSAMLRDHREVVRDVDHRHALLVAQPVELDQDAILREHVEPGRRLVEHGHRRLADAGHRDRHPLLLAAGELVRIAPRKRASAPSSTRSSAACTDSVERGRRRGARAGRPGSRRRPAATG